MFLILVNDLKSKSQYHLDHVVLLLKEGFFFDKMIYLLLFVLVRRIFVLRPFLCLSVGFLVYNVAKNLLIKTTALNQYKIPYQNIALPRQAPNLSEYLDNNLFEFSHSFSSTNIP